VTNRFQLAGYQKLAQINVRRAVRTLSRGRIVVTDRLHAAVLGTLLGLPVIAMDNSYGKVSSIYNDYLGSLPAVMFAETATAVKAMIDAMGNR